MGAKKESVYGRLHNKVTLITGAASGIGQQTALLFAREGAKVAASDINIKGSEDTAREIEAAGGLAISIKLDVTSETDWNSAIHEVEDRWGRLNVLVNCAGITDDAPLAELTLAQWRHVMSVNMEGTFLGTAAAIRFMTPSGTGSIINVSSASGIKASPGASAYCASKAAVIQFSKTAALECAQAKNTIRVNCVVPGGVKTPMWETTSMWPQIASSDAWEASIETAPLSRFANPLEIAQPILFLASDESSFITGTALIVDGGYTA